MSNQIFATAAEVKLRFQSGNGRLSVEDLWDYPMSKLKKLGNDLHRTITEAGSDDLFGDSLRSNVENADVLRLDIIKYIVAEREARTERVRKAKETRAHNAKIDALIEQKKDAALGGLSIEELAKLRQ